jgi:hypothetical protein
MSPEDASANSNTCRDGTEDAKDAELVTLIQAAMTAQAAAQARAKAKG